MLAPFCRTNADGTPKFQLPGHAGQPLPYLGYAPGAYLGHMVELVLKQSSVPIHLDRVYETDMAEGLKAMALEGHGVAFLPLSAVRKELRSHKLVSAGTGFEITMEVRVYRERPNARNAAKRHAQDLWVYLQSHADSKGNAVGLGVLPTHAKPLPAIK
jgi:DNA-binding transcriptional LysR family regulator